MGLRPHRHHLLADGGRLIRLLGHLALTAVQRLHARLQASCKSVELVGTMNQLRLLLLGGCVGGGHRLPMLLTALKLGGTLLQLDLTDSHDRVI